MNKDKLNEALTKLREAHLALLAADVEGRHEDRINHALDGIGSAAGYIESVRDEVR